jgi:hypothetical protein
MEGAKLSGLWKYRPSPAMIVATVALFVAMGGTGYAVSQLPKGSVGSAQLRRSAVRSKHIKAGSITKAKLAQSTLSALRAPAPAGVGGPVTSSAAPDRVGNADRAGYADKAGYADRAGYADKAGIADSASSLDAAAAARIAAQAADAVLADLPASTGGNTPRWVEPFTIAEGTKDMLKVGPFTLTARCRVSETINGTGGQDQADIIISTTQAKSAFDGDDLLGQLDPTDNIETRQFVNTEEVPSGQPRFEASSDGLAIGGDGKVYIKGSYLFASMNVNGEAGKCKFGGYIFL